MNNLTVYRILTYVLLAIAGFLSLLLIGMLLAALVNPVLLLQVFLLACVIIYSYCSFRFLNRGIDAHLYCRPSLRDLIRVNGYGTLAFASLNLVVSCTLLVRPGMLNEVAEQALSMQKEQVEGMEEMMINYMKYTLRFLLFYSAALLVHVYMSFRLIRLHADAFDIPTNPQ
ncbi:hypothetical protein [Flavihumibacter sp. CACIAM 22H1]|uniref:hypothetical protein n=1 Tax=Flavihumibacter sp. CACIAM 22H1 TaxID=1812911 RepID=UPI0007A8CD98|nr:hypothetical protein [Flavihumibacter sp. CACIAM 22H1]KYP13077.1 MAG: hypothetical protein A1D16_07420 [Flavihumibacter sp. CACIAM 22H1]